MPEPGAVPVKDLKEEHFQPKWYINGFPKSGLHWLALMMMPVAKPLFDDHELWNVPWAGTFRMNSWTSWTVPMERVTYKVGRLTDGHYLKGHSAYSDELERFLWYLGAAAIFVYRDFRDVAVSQAHHVLSDRDDLMVHPDKDHYRALGSFDETLKAVIGGTETEEGVVYPGVMERWAYYAGWLDVDWMCQIRFEELKADTHAIAVRILRHGLQRVSNVFGVQPDVVEDNLDLVASWMVQAGKRTEKSPTFRKGTTGDWRAHFTPQIKALFKETDSDNWLERLGYERDADW